MQEGNDRYSRQVLLKNFGTVAQQKLLDTKVLVVGAGGLGCPALQYLTAAGVGTIGIADADTVSLSNLQRQVLYTTADIGSSKTSVAAARLRQMNPEISIVVHALMVNNKNALSLFNNYDLILDGTDNFATRYLINDACVLLGKPLVFGAVYQYEGQVAVFNSQDANGISIHYRHIFPESPGPDEAPDCAAAGVLGTLPGIVGILQATEIIKLITGIGKPLRNAMLTWNALSAESTIIDLSPAATSTIIMPKTMDEYEAMDYPAFCNNAIGDHIQLINSDAFSKLLKNENIAIIDVREVGEEPSANFRNIQAPLSTFVENIGQIEHYNEIALFCQSGARSLKAARLLAEHFNKQKKIYSLVGGILSLQQSTTL